MAQSVALRLPLLEQIQTLGARSGNRGKTPGSGRYQAGCPRQRTRSDRG
jgi:hypothetical protein